MKIRNGFVSNSSSSSFVIIGYKSSEIFSKDIDKESIIRKYAPKFLESEANKKYGIEDIWTDFLYNTNFGIDGVSYLSDDDKSYIGIVLADVKSDEGCVDDTELSLEDIMKKVNALQDIFNIKKLPKIYTGTRSC